MLHWTTKRCPFLLLRPLKGLSDRLTIPLFSKQCDCQQREKEGTAATLRAAPESCRNAGERHQGHSDGVDDRADSGQRAKPAKLPGQEGNPAPGVERWVPGTGPRRNGARHCRWVSGRETTRLQGARAESRVAPDSLHVQRLENAGESDDDEVKVGQLLSESLGGHHGRILVSLGEFQGANP